MDTSSMVQIITAATALVAVVVGPWQTAKTTRKQIRATVVSANRQQWINTLRNDLAELITAFQIWGSPLKAKHFNQEDRKETLSNILLRESKIRMMLNPNEADHQELIATMASVRSFAEDDDVPQTIGDVQDRLDIRIERLIKQSQVILKREWERVKSGD
jgi:hypothetical protein